MGDYEHAKRELVEMAVFLGSQLIKQLESEWQYFMSYDGHVQSEGALTYEHCDTD